MRGQIKEKMDLCFNLFDHGHKKYLNSEEINCFLDILIKAITISYSPEHADFFNGRYLEFRKRILGEYCSNGRMNFTDLAEIVKDPFIFEISNHYRGLTRKDTSSQVAATINHNTFFLKTEKE